MASIDCLIDTTPMANEISRVSHSVNGTTTAVVGMKAAVIKAEADAADHICRNVNRGFYALIHSQISQKIAKLQSEVDSHLMKLNHLRKQLLALKDRMEHDYQMTCARYTKLFNGINRNLRQRVYELDRPTMDIVEKDAGRMSKRLNMLIATVPVTQKESITASQRILVSDVKHQTENTIRALGQFLADNQHQDAVLSSIMLKRRLDEPNCDINVPVIIMETNYDRSDDSQVSIFANPKWIDDRTAQSIKERVTAYDSDIHWTRNKAMDPELRSELSKLVGTANLNPRVKKLVMAMIKNSDINSIASD